MEEKKRRGARPGAVRSKPTVPPVTLDAVEAAIEEAVPSGPQYLRRDLDGFRLAHVLAVEAGKGTTFHAFEAISACASRAVADVDHRREAAGLAPLADAARETRDLVVQIPFWAVVALFHGWMRASRGDVNANERREGPLPVVEAFGLGAGGDRTVARRHVIFARDVKLAVGVAMALHDNPGLSENRAFQAVAADAGQPLTTVRNAWSDHGAPARRFVAEHLARNGQPNAKP